MSSINVSKENNKENESAKPNPIIENIKSRYILSKIYDIMSKKKKLEIVKYNKKIQNRINLFVKDYKEYSETFSPIEIEIIPIKINMVDLFISMKMINYIIIYILMIIKKKQKINMKFMK